MNNPSKANLEKLLNLIDEICAIEENRWFKESLSSKFSSENGFENFPAFLRYQKSQFRIKGRLFYKDIPDIKLKNELINDYIEMSWYQSINNLDRFMLFVFYQMENLINYYILISNAFEKIRVNKEYSTYEYSPKFIVNIKKDFYNHNNDEKSIEKIRVWSKLTFWMIDSKNYDWEEKNHRNLSNLITIRNSISHRSSNIKNEYIDRFIKNLKESSFSDLGYYINVLKKILESCKSVDSNVKNH